MLRLKTLLLTAAAAAAAALLALALNPATPSYAADLYPYGQCTYYAKLVRPDIGNHWGNARYWASSARRAGFPVSSKPMVGDVVVFGAYVQGNSPYGHVGLVTAVRGSQFKVVSMWGTEANGRIHVTWHHTGGGVSFIHRKGTVAAKPAAKTSAKATPKPVAKAVTKPAAKAKPAARPAAKVTAKPAVKPAVKATPKPAAKPAVKATPKPATKPGAKATPKAATTP